MGDHHLARQAEQHVAEIGGEQQSLLYEGRWYTPRELLDRAARIGSGLQDLGVTPGDRVVAVMANSPDVGVLYQALWRIGGVPTPAMFLLPPPEIRHIVTEAQARFVVASPELVPSVSAAVEGLDVTVIGDGGDTADGLTLDALAESAPRQIVDRDDADLAALLYTGGTTGRSKGVMLTHGNLWHAGRSGRLALEEEDEELTRTLVPLPLAHSFGLLVTAIGMFGAADDRSVLMRWFDPAAALALIAEHRIEQATMVPTMITLLLAQPLEDHDLSSLGRIVCGSAPLPAKARDQLEVRVPSVTVCEGYGLTETSAATTTDRMSRRRKGTVGQPLPGTEIRLADDGGAAVPPGEPGEVLVRSASVSPGYWRAPEATARTFVDGWCKTGDVGVLDDEGYLRIVDRKKDLIIRGGFNVYPRDVEDALLEHPGIAGAGVVGRPDDVYGEEVVAFVTPVPGAALDEEQLVAWAKERIGPKAYPRHIRVVDALPLTPVLKLDRKQLRAMT